MSYFYLEGQLHGGSPEQSVKIVDLARRHGTPLYIYNIDSIRQRHHAMARAFQGRRHSIHYAMKANNCHGVLKELASLGCGVDTVSGGEIRLALELGFQPSQVIFSGVGKTTEEIRFALNSGLKQINIESLQELERISQLSKAQGTSVDIAFRMNPDVHPKTHPYITTGFRENKFGLHESLLPQLLDIVKISQGHLRLRGLTMHIGSQILDLSSFQNALIKLKALFDSLCASGLDLDRLDIGGGLGLDYDSGDESQELKLIEDYGKMVKKTMGTGRNEILLEPGRVLVGRSGLLVSEVQYVKKTSEKNFVVLDTGMHHLLRPALYEARHRVLPIVESAERATTIYDIVGPICESSDFLAKNISLPELYQGDLLGIADTGAYGATMASRYNLHEYPKEICF